MGKFCKEKIKILRATIISNDNADTNKIIEITGLTRRQVLHHGDILHIYRFLNKKVYFRKTGNYAPAIWSITKGRKELIRKILKENYPDEF